MKAIAMGVHLWCKWRSLLWEFICDASESISDVDIDENIDGHVEEEDIFHSCVIINKYSSFSSAYPLANGNDLDAIGVTKTKSNKWQMDAINKK